MLLWLGNNCVRSEITSSIIKEICAVGSRAIIEDGDPSTGLSEVIASLLLMNAASAIRVCAAHVAMFL